MATGLGIRCSIRLSYGGINLSGPILPVGETYTKAGVFARGLSCSGESRRPGALLVPPLALLSPGVGRQISPLAPFLLLHKVVGT